MLKLMGKNVIITGASRGLGAEIARKMWQQGANILLTARDAISLETSVKKLERRPEQRVYFIPVDLALENSLDNIMATAQSHFEQLDILVNNAAMQGPIGVAWENDWSMWQQTIRVNLLAPIDLSRQCARWMIPHKSGKIIFLSGGGATSSRPNFSAYAVAKTGLVRFSEILAQELHPYNIQVNCISPGVMTTSILNEILIAGREHAGDKEYNSALEIQERTGTSTEMPAELSVFLASPASDGVTGKLISAVWDPWQNFPEHLDELKKTDIYTLRRIVPKDRGMDWGDV